MKNINIHKFGGASVCTADGVKKMLEIVGSLDGKLVIVVSAMGKTTNTLEKIITLWYDQNLLFWDVFQEMKKYHQTIIDGLFGLDDKGFEPDFNALKNTLEENPSLDYNYEYDRIVSFGEIISTKIIARFIQNELSKTKWIDVRNTLKTDQIFREATVDWELSATLAKKYFKFNSAQIIITQGFIGSTINNLTTTLGREGSDYTAAALAWLLDAQSVTVWKDVPGIMNADPKWLPNAISLEKLSYSETVELSYFGAKVIHPKTLRPLQQKNIPLYVRSFVNPKFEGTLISNIETQQIIPFYIRKENQILVTLFPQDFSFMAYDNVKTIHDLFHQYRLQINLIQMSALSYSVCFDYKPEVWDSLRNSLSKIYRIKYNTSSELITIRHFTQEAIENVICDSLVFLEQRTRKTVQFVIQAKS